MFNKVYRMTIIFTLTMHIRHTQNKDITNQPFSRTIYTLCLQYNSLVLIRLTNVAKIRKKAADEK